MNKKMRELLEKIKTKKDLADKLISQKQSEEAERVLGECKELQKEFEEEKERYEKEKANVNFNNKDTGLATFKDAIMPGQKFTKSTYDMDKEDRGLELGNMVKALIKGNVPGVEKERAYISKTMSAGGSVVIPQDMADKILDMARESSALFGRVPTINMLHNNLTVAVQTKDPVASFVNEGEPIPASDLSFGTVKLEGKTLAIYVPVTEQLLDSAPNINDVLLNAVTKAIGVALDKAMLYGKGKATEAQAGSGQQDEIQGLFTRSDINKVGATAGDWDFVVKGTSPIRKANLVPTDIVYNTDMADKLAVLKDKDGKYMDRPSFCDRYTFNESNNMNDNNALAYDMQSLLLGIHKNMKLDIGYGADDFQRIQKAIRIYMRCDFVPVNPKGVTAVTFTA